MTLTVANCANWIELSLGGQPSSQAGVLELVNLSGLHMVGMTRWRFLEGADVLLSTVADQEYIDLPSNFSTPISLCGSTINSDVAWASREDIAMMRQSPSVSGNGGVYFFATSFSAATGATPPVPRLEIFPTPESATTDQFRLVYRAGWAALTSDSDYVPIPEYCRALFVRILGAFTRGLHREEQGSVDARLMEIRNGPIFAAAQKDDKTKQVDRGLIRGSIYQSGWRDGAYPRIWTSTGP